MLSLSGAPVGGRPTLESRDDFGVEIAYDELGNAIT